MPSLAALSFDGPIDPHFSKEPTAILLLIIAAFFVFFGLFSQLIRGRYFIPSPVLAIVLGIVLGPKGLGLLATAATGTDGWVNGSEGSEARELLAWFCRIVLGIQVLSAGLNLPSRWVTIKQNLTTLLTLLLPVMASASLLSALFAYLIIPDLTFFEAMVIGSCLGPTDPVLAGSVIKGHFAERHVAPELRNVLLAESGVNDGLGTPFLYLSLSLLFAFSDLKTHSPKTGGGIVGHYLVSVILWNVLVSFLVGVTIGYMLLKLLKFSRDRKWIDENSTLVFGVAVSIGLVGITTMMDTNQLLCCFVAGCVLNWEHDMGAVLNNQFSEGLDNVMDIVIFTFLGAVLPFDTWRGENSPTSFGKLCGVAALVILFRRLPAVLLCRKGLPSIGKYGEVIFAGWFGPIGIGALYYSLEASEKLPGSIDLEQQTFQIVSFLVFISVLVHGLTIPFFLLLTLFFPNLAPYLLGDRSDVGEDFGQQGHLSHLIDTANDSSNESERSPLIKRGQEQRNGTSA